MAKVRLTTEETLDWIVSGARDLSPEERAKLKPGELDSAFRLREPGSADAPQLVELRYAPDSEISHHWHDEDEILYVLRGEMRVGNRALGPGTSLSITGGTVYGFRAGAEGLTILNFRPRTDASFHLPEERRAR